MTGLVLCAALITPPELAPPPRPARDIGLANQDALRKLDRMLREKLVQEGAKEPEKKSETPAQALRWVLRFQTRDGKDYVEQLKLLNATLLVPDPSDKKKAILVPDLSKPEDRREATDEDYKRLSDRVKFSDSRIDAVKGVAGALGLDFTPKEFQAFLSKDVEDELARKEREYRTRRVDDIEQTIFRIVVRNGKVVITVVEQRVKP